MFDITDEIIPKGNRHHTRTHTYSKRNAKGDANRKVSRHVTPGYALWLFLWVVMERMGRCYWVCVCLYIAKFPLNTRQMINPLNNEAFIYLFALELN